MSNISAGDGQNRQPEGQAGAGDSDVKHEQSAGAVVFRRTPEGLRFLLLKIREPFRPPYEPYWGLPKGHIETGEASQQSAAREVEEEAGLTDLNFIDGFEEQIVVDFTRQITGELPPERVQKTVTYFLAETKTEQVKIEEPHLDHAWLSPEEAAETVKYDGVRQVVRKAALKVKS